MLLAQTRAVAPARPSIAKTLFGWLSLRQERRALAKLDARALNDVGISAKAAQSEASRPFWDAPDHWCR